MTKQYITEQHLGEFVIIPSESELSFKKCWRTVEPTESVDIRYLHNKHGNALKTSHSAKTKTM